MENLSTQTQSVQNGAIIPDLSIILVCWNNKDYLEPCLESIYQGGLRSRYDVVAVDNGSTDGTQGMLREKYPQVLVLQNNFNVGLGKASNQGIKATRGRHILLLNNDTVVNGPSLDAMVEYLDKHPGVAAVGGKLLNPDGSVQSCNNRFSSLSEEFLIATRIGDLFSPGYPANITDTKVKSVDWMSSACLMLRRASLNDVGLLDEEYFIYGDEEDIQYRFKRAGWQIIFLPQATTIHYGGRSMNRWSRRKMVYRGKLLFYQKNYGRLRTTVLRLMLAGLSLGKLIIWSLAFIYPPFNERARRELRSNIEVFIICYNVG